MYISVGDAAKKFNISNRRIQLLCEQGRIEGAIMISGVWLIPDIAQKPLDSRRKNASYIQPCLLTNEESAYNSVYDIDAVSKALSVSTATVRNWIRLGKLIPDIDNQFFSKRYLEQFISLLETEDDSKLKSRRNKNRIAGRFLYKNYIHNKNNQSLVSEILALDLIENEKDLNIIISNFAIQLYYQSIGIKYEHNNVLSDFLSQDTFNEFHILISDLLHISDKDFSIPSRLLPILEKEITFVKGEDSLGFVYLSLRDIGIRKSRGAYYTPEKIVNEMIDKLYANDTVLQSKTICDPCCGTGNFLLRLIERGVNYSNLRGQDIDSTSIYLARINIALLTPDFTANEIRKRFTIGNTLFDSFKEKFNVIIGNPPWGSSFSEEEKDKYRAYFRTAQGKSIESYDLFLEKALTMLTKDGIVAFVLPEAILNVASHHIIRELIINSCSFKFISYLGNAFNGVQCPCIFIGITPDPHPTSIGCRVFTKSNNYVISTPRTFSNGTLSFNISDREMECLDAISNIDNAVFLKGNAAFALGIVTGNNKEYISSKQQNDNEIVLKGSDIKRYGPVTSENYIHFTPENFQQVAPLQLYRAEEKLLYRFISEVPVFTYDNKQTLSLNSCNIVIPKIKDLSMKYVLAILNSSVSAYFISKKFNSVKILRSHIEQIPIPKVSQEVQQEISSLVDSMLSSPIGIKDKYESLDAKIMSLYKLDNQQITTIKKSLKDKSLFLQES